MRAHAPVADRAVGDAGHETRRGEPVGRRAVRHDSRRRPAPPPPVRRRRRAQRPRPDRGPLPTLVCVSRVPPPLSSPGAVSQAARRPAPSRSHQWLPAGCRWPSGASGEPLPPACDAARRRSHVWDRPTPGRRRGQAFVMRAARCDRRPSANGPLISAVLEHQGADAEQVGDVGDLRALSQLAVMSPDRKQQRLLELRPQRRRRHSAYLRSSISYPSFGSVPAASRAS